jgi:type II secretion system protein N
MDRIIDQLREWWEQRNFRIAVFIGFGILVLMVSLVATFPKHRVTEIAEVQMESALNHEYDVTIGEFRFWRLTGVQLRNVRLRERQTPGAGESEGPPRVVIIERASGRLAPLRTVINRGLTAHVQVDVGGGLINGYYVQAGGAQRVQVRMNNLDLRQSTLLASLLGVPLFGQIDGEIDVELNPRHGGIQSGEIQFAARQLTLGTTTVRSEAIPVFTELELPTTSFGNLRTKIVIEELNAARGASRLVFEEFQSQGRDISLQIWGHVDLVPGGARPSLQMRMQLSQDYVTENSLGFLLNMQEFRDGHFENWYGFTLERTFQNLRGSTEAARGPSARPAGQEAAEDREEDEE